MLASTDFLSRLQSATSEDERERLVLEISLDYLDESARNALRTAAIPHWFDKSFLGTLLQKSDEEAGVIIEQLKRLSYVEEFAGRGFNIHERTRKSLIKYLRDEFPEQYIEMSKRAAHYCSKKIQVDSFWYVEFVYHIFAFYEEIDSQLFLNLYWNLRQAPPDVVEKIAFHLKEHRDGNRINPSNLWIIFFEAVFEYWLSNFKLAQEELLKARDLPNTDLHLKAVIAFTLGELLGSLNNNYQESINNYQSALVTFGHIGDSYGELLCNDALARSHHAHGESEKAKEYFQRLFSYYYSEIQRSEEVDDQQRKSEYYESLGEISLIMNDIETANHSFRMALEWYEQLENVPGIARCYERLGDLYNHNGRSREALYTYETCLQLYEQLQNTLGIARCSEKIGDFYSLQGEYQTALEIYMRVLDIYRKSLGNLFIKPNFLPKISKCLLNLQRYDEAQNVKVLIQQLIDHFNETSNYLGAADCAFDLAGICHEFGDNKSAKYWYQEALEYFLTTGLSERISSTYDQLSHLAAKSNEFEKAREYHQQAVLYAEMNPHLADRPSAEPEKSVSKNIVFRQSFAREKRRSTRRRLRAEIEITEKQKEQAEAEKIPDADFNSLLEHFKQVLGERVTDVRASTRLSQFVARLADADGTLNPELQRVYKYLGKEYEVPKKILELNPTHSILKSLLKLEAGSDLQNLIIEQIYDSALLVEGLHPDPSSIAPRVQQIIEAALKQNSE